MARLYNGIFSLKKDRRTYGALYHHSQNRQVDESCQVVKLEENHEILECGVSLMQEKCSECGNNVNIFNTSHPYSQNS